MIYKKIYRKQKIEQHKTPPPRNEVFLHYIQLQIINSVAIWKCYTSKLVICAKYVSVTESPVFQ